ncbi:hypothetical protein FO519_008358 [Halicephalobus sp. NKZ332]|nr:hypothetical protein FO519_008358 [Halicephalobus sp. NKZ332]
MDDSKVSNITFEEYDNYVYSKVISFNGILALTLGTFVRIWFYILLLLYGGVNIAVFSAFIYRLALLKGKLKTIMGCKCLSLLGLLHVFNQVPAIVNHHLSSSNYTVVEAAIVERYPNIIKYFTDQDMACFVISFDVGAPYNYLYFICPLIYCSITFTFIVFMIIRTKALLQEKRAIISHKTYLMHKELLKTLIFQFITPLFTLTIPVLAFIVLIILKTDSTPYLFQAMWVFATCHSTMNTVMMVYFIKPYREKCIHIFWYILRKSLAVIHNSSDIHPRNDHGYSANR